MKEICAIAKELSDKNTWVKKNVREMMETWAKISSCGEHVRADTIVIEKEGYDNGFYLHAGENEVLRWDFLLEKYVTYNSDCYFETEFTMTELRNFLNNFEKMVNEIKIKMEQRSESTEKITELLQKIKLKG